MNKRALKRKSFEFRFQNCICLKNDSTVWYSNWCCHKNVRWVQINFLNKAMQTKIKTEDCQFGAATFVQTSKPRGHNFPFQYPNCTYFLINDSTVWYCSLSCYKSVWGVLIKFSKKVLQTKTKASGTREAKLCLAFCANKLALITQIQNLGLKIFFS